MLLIWGFATSREMKYWCRGRDVWFERFCFCCVRLFLRECRPAMGMIHDKVLKGKVEFVGVARRSYQKERGVSDHHVSFGRTVELSQLSASD